VVIAAAVGLTSCVHVPDEGPIVVAEGKGQPPPVEAEFNKPKGPQPGQSAEDVVTGFLEAMTATPLQTNTALEFLARRAQQRWDPQQRVVAYSYHTPAHGTHDVVVRLRGAEQVGRRGQWHGAVPPSGRRLVFPMTREDNEWRIAAAPDALVVPRPFYDQQYQDAQLYFFDPSAKILVPEPVHVPQGPQLASSLVFALLHGPSGSESGVSRTFIPPGLTVDSVPVGSDGVADVSLRGKDPGPLSNTTVDLMVAQLAWTLREDPEIQSFRLSIAGHSVSDSTGAQTFKVTSAPVDRYDPAVSLASSQIYALRRGRLVSGQVGHPTKVTGPFGTQPLGISRFAVRLDGLQVAAVTSSALLVGPVVGTSPPDRVLNGSGLLRPAWDFAGRLWNVQNGPSGAQVICVDRGRTRTVKVPGISGADVHRFLVSRDGSRIVAVLRGGSSDRIVVSRIRYNANGRATGATRARGIPWESGGTTRIRDLGWTTPTTIAVLDQLSRVTAEVRILNVDGSMPPDESSPTLINGRVTGLVTSPVDTQTPYAVQHDALYDISQVELPRPVPNKHLRHLTYAG
jgi:hypothetical protein